MTNFSFIWLILVFYTANKCILQTWICLFICKISLLSLSVVFGELLWHQLWRRWEWTSWRFLVLFDWGFPCYFWSVVCLSFPHICLHHDRCALIHTAQHRLPALPARKGSACTVFCTWLNSQQMLLSQSHPETHPLEWVSSETPTQAAFCSDTLTLTGSCFCILAHLGKRCNKATTCDSHSWKSPEFCPSDSSSDHRGNPAVSVSQRTLQASGQGSEAS